MVKYIVLPDTEKFLFELVEVLIDKSGENAVDFFRQTVRLCYNKEEQLKIGLKYVTKHPRFLTSELALMQREHQDALVLDYGMQAIDMMPENMEARGEIARMTAAAAYHLGKYDEEIKALKAQFVSSCCRYAIYALLTRSKMNREEIDALLQKVKDNSRNDRSREEDDERSSFFFIHHNELYVSFFAGDYESILDYLSERPYAFRTDPLLTLLVYAINEGNAQGRVIGELMNAVEKAFHETLYNDYLPAKERMENWMSFGYLKKIEKQYIFDELKPFIDKNVGKILSLQERKMYDDAAMLLVGLLNAGVALGEFDNINEPLAYYLEYYKRYTAFTRAIHALL